MVQLPRCGRWASTTFSKLQSQNKSLSGFSTAAAEGNEATPFQSSSPPPPIRVSFTESAGRGVFATRLIAAGELLHTAKPVVSHPSISTLHTVCYFCLKRIQSQPSGVVQFCSAICTEQSKAFYEVERIADWSTYNDYCRTRGLKYPLLVKRLACMVISGVASADSLDILQPASLSPAMILEMQEEFNMLRGAFTSADVADSQMAFLTSQWYTGVLSRIRINAFRIELAGGSYKDLFSSAVASVGAEAAVGNAIYVLPSFYNHDCDPNAHILWIDNVDAKLKALRDIAAGEELRICYIDASMDYNARQIRLSQGFGFQCCCFRCLSGD